MLAGHLGGSLHFRCPAPEVSSPGVGVAYRLQLHLLFLATMSVAAINQTYCVRVTSVDEVFLLLVFESYAFCSEKSAENTVLNAL